MRISELSKVTGIPLATLKDLRHREILQLAVSTGLEKPPEGRSWGQFSVPAAIIVFAAKEVREQYGMGWNEAVSFARNALAQVRWPVDGAQVSAKFFDLNGVPEEVWVGRFEFSEGTAFHGKWNADNWNCFACVLPDIGDQQAKITAKLRDALGNEAPADVAPTSCLLMNASRLLRDFRESMCKHGLWSE